MKTHIAIITITFTNTFDSVTSELIDQTEMMLSYNWSGTGTKRDYMGNTVCNISATFEKFLAGPLRSRLDTLEAQVQGLLGN